MEWYVILSSFFGWKFITKLQRNFIVFTTISNYIIFKLILSVLIGWAVTPFYLFGYVMKMINRRSKNVSKE